MVLWQIRTTHSRRVKSNLDSQYPLAVILNEQTVRIHAVIPDIEEPNIDKSVPQSSLELRFRRRGYRVAILEYGD